MACHVCEIPVSFLVDSGASCTLMDYSVFKAVADKQELQLTPIKERFVLADGSEMRNYGQASITLTIGSREYDIDVVIADLGYQSAILGLDSLEDQNTVLKVQSGTLLIDDVPVLLYRERAQKGCCEIRVHETLTIPPRSCRVVDVEVDLRELANGEKTDLRVGAVEGLSTLADISGLVMDRGVVAVYDDKVPVNLINVHDAEITLHKGKTLGNFQLVNSVTELMPPDEQKSRSERGKLLTKKDIPGHVTPILDEAELTVEQESKACDLALRYVDVFKTPEGRTGRTDWDEHPIDAQGNAPVKGNYRPLPMAKQSVCDDEVEKMLKDDVIEPSNSPWAAPIVMVTKRDGSIRFCVDYRKLNSLTRKDAYPLPRIDDTLNTLGGADWFCTMDLASGYWQIKMREEDKPKTAFVTRKGLFQFKVMPFGLSNAPATFQRLMEKVLMGLQWQKCLVYLDDIIVFGRDFDETLVNLECVMERLKQAGLKLKPSKCRWFQKSVKYLGHIVSKKGIECDPEKVEAVQHWPVPATVKEVRQFLGFAAYYRKFIPNFSDIAKPLTNLTKKSVRFKWDKDCQRAFQIIKEKLVSAPVLSYPMGDEGDFVLDTDASDFAMGAVLSQMQQGEERVIAYASKTLSREQQNYCTTKKELLAAVHFVEHFRQYLYGRHFVIRTDHSSLKWLRNFKNIDGMLARWLASLDRYDYTIVHRKGDHHRNVDGLSRIPTRKCPRPECPQCTLQVSPVAVLIPKVSSEETEDGNGKDPVPGTEAASEEWLQGWTMEELREWQRADPHIFRIMAWKENSPSRPPWREVMRYGRDTKAYVTQWDSLFLRDAILHRTWYPRGAGAGVEPVHQVVAPREIRTQLLKSLHDGPTGGHLGRFKTVERVRYRFYWPRYKEETANWCKQCDLCAQAKPGPPRKRAKLGQVPVGAPLERIAVDIMGPLPKTGNGNEYIVVIGDYFTKWTEAFALKNHTAQTVAEVIVQEFVGRFGVPRQIHSDQGREFESLLISHLCQLLHIKKTRTTPYNPKSDGMVERANRTVKQMLSVLVNEAQDNWDDHLPYIMMAYRASVHESTKCTPNLLMLNRETNLPVDIMIGSPPGTTTCPNAYVEWVRQASEHAFEFVQKQLHTSAERQKTLYDRNSGTPKFQVGQTVWRYYPPRAKRKFGRG